jgi:electron transfer flavoprotein alpha subunit
MIAGLIELDRGRISDVSLQMLTLARSVAQELAVPLEAALIGADMPGMKALLSAYGVTAVHLAQDGRLHDSQYAPEAWAQCVTHIIETAEPQAVFAPGTDRGSEVMAHVAARVGLPLAANCVAIRPGETYEVTRLRWGGSLLEEARLSGRPKLMTVAPHAITAEPLPTPVETAVHLFTPSLDDTAFRARVARREETAGDTVTLSDARVVVGGGRGVGSAEGFAPLEALADLLGGAVGASRAVTSNGWRSHADQIGQTGTRIAADLYIACGISGAIQHMVGCAGAKRILAINTDAEAPIVAKADYAVIGDLHEIVPALIAEIKRARSG